MQNKGFVKVFAVLLTLVFLFYFSIAIRYFFCLISIVAGNEGKREVEHAYLMKIRSNPMERGYKVPTSKEKKAFLIEKNMEVELHAETMS